MKRIINPWKKDTGNRYDYNCFGCSPFNDIGLQLEFWEDGDELIATWLPRKSLEGWMGVLHGGIQATLLDEIAGWIVMIKMKTAGVTAKMDIEYFKPLIISKGEIRIRGRVVSVEKRLVVIECWLNDGEGVECAKGKITYFYFPERIAKAKYHYPGIEAFYEN